MELDDRLTFMLLQRFDRRPDELAGFDRGLVQHTKARLLDEGYVINAPVALRGDDEVKTVFDHYELTPRGKRLFMQLQRKLGK